MSPFSVLQYIWASPATLIGAGMTGVALIAGARLCIHTGVLEVSFRPRRSWSSKAVKRLPFSAITLGHVVVACSEMEQEYLRAHERVHVAQFERWGALLLLAYPAESALQFLLGRLPYLDNRFEVPARVKAANCSHAGVPSGA